MKRWLPMSIGLFVSACGGPGPAPAPQGISVGPNVVVSATYANRQHHEMLSAVDPIHPNRMLACTRTFTHSNVLKNVVYRSLDGGGSWSPVFEDPNGTDNGDPACDWGLGNTAYYAMLGGKIGPHEGDDLELYVSKDAGKRWRLAAPHPFVDREYVSVDKSNSRYRGRVYVYGNAGRMMVLRNHSLDPEIFPPKLSGYTISSPNQAVITDDGTIVYPLWAIKGNPTADNGRNSRAAAVRLGAAARGYERYHAGQITWKRSKFTRHTCAHRAGGRRNSRGPWGVRKRIAARRDYCKRDVIMHILAHRIKAARDRTGASCRQGDKSKSSRET